MTTTAKKILIVDDEEHQIDTVRRGLFLYGYESQGAHDAESALEIIKGPGGDSIDLILTDLTMPGNSGLYLIEQVEKVKPELPVIVVTGLAATNEVDAVRRKGIPVLQKPFEPEGLVKAIRSILGS